MSTLDFIQNRYPKGIRRDAKLSGRNDNFGYEDNAPTGSSLTFKYDMMRAFVVDVYRSELFWAMHRLKAITADADGMEEWEDFLQMANRDDLDDQSRRGLILAKLFGSSPTMETIRKIVINLVGGSGDNVTFYERYNEPSPTELDLWTYEIRITRPTTNEFTTTQLYEELLKAHPYHANLILVVESELAESMAFQDSAIITILTTGYWGDDTGYPSGMVWSGETPGVGTFIWASD